MRRTLPSCCPQPKTSPRISRTTPEGRSGRSCSRQSRRRGWSWSCGNKRPLPLACRAARNQCRAAGQGRCSHASWRESGRLHARVNIRGRASHQEKGYSTLGRSWHRAWHRSLMLALRLRGQSAVNLASHSMIVPLPPCWSISRCRRGRQLRRPQFGDYRQNVTMPPPMMINAPPARMGVSGRVRKRAKLTICQTTNRVAM